MLENIFAQPNYIDGVGSIYPIKLKDYDKFIKCSNVLYISKNHYQENEHPLFYLLLMTVEQLGFTYEQLINNLETLFSLVTHNEFFFIQNERCFQFEYVYKDENGLHKNYINAENYEVVRSIIMKQNLLFEQKTYKDKLVQEWADKVMENRIRNAPKISIEDMITTVKNFDGLTYDQIMNQTIYQLYADFHRIRKMKRYDTETLFATVSTEKMTINDFAEELNIHKSPYDDLFVSSDTLNKFKDL